MLSLATADFMSSPALLAAAARATGTWLGDPPPSSGQATDVSAERPPIGSIGEELTLLAFLLVMLVVPWLMAHKPAEGDPRAGSTGSADPAPYFSSHRERRLWTWTLVVLVAIYATLSPAQELAAALRERNLLRVTTGAGLFLVAAVVVALWARTRPGRFEVGAAVGIAAVYVVTLIRLPVPEARSHLFEYGLVAMLIYQALLERRRNGRRVPVPAVTAVVATTLLGWVDEAIQAFLPTRVYDLRDVGFNALAGLMAVVASAFLAWVRRWDIALRLPGRR